MSNNNNDKSIPVSICILTYNRWFYLDRLIDDILKINYKPLEIIIVDNSDNDETKNKLKDKSEKVKYYKSEKNIGIAARNIGIKNAKGEIIFMLDDDVYGLDENKIRETIHIFSEDKDIGAINFKVLDAESNQIINWVHHCKVEDFYNKTFDTYEITEGAVAFRKKLFDIVGYYVEYFFISHEGPDLAFRIMNYGYKVIYTPEIELVHFIADEGRLSWRNYYYDTRNQLWLAIRNFPVIFSFKYLLRGQSAMLLYSIRDGFLNYWFRGIVDAIKKYKFVLNDRNVLKPETMNLIKIIDANRPSLLYYLKIRLFKNKIQI